MKNWMVLIIEIILLYFVYRILVKIYNKERKEIDNEKIKMGEFDFTISIYALFLFFVIYHSLCIYDINGNLTFPGLNYWENCIYETANHEQYYLEKGRLTNVDNKDKVYQFEHAYLDRKGNLVLDTCDEYKQSSYLGVYVNSENQRVYRIDYCSWDILGRIVLPEGIGIHINDSYYKLLQFNTVTLGEPEFYSDKAETLEILLFSGFAISILVFAVLGFYNSLKQSFNTEYCDNNEKNKIYYKVMNVMSFLFMPFFAAYIQLCLLSFKHYSLFKMLICFIIFRILVKKYFFPYGAGFSKVEEIKDVNFREMDSITTAKWAYGLCEEKDVNKYMKVYYIILLIYIIMWIAFSINICHGRI